MIEEANNFFTLDNNVNKIKNSSQLISIKKKG